MKKIKLLFAMIFMATMIAGANAQIVRERPMAPRIVRPVPPRPGMHHVWVPGEWQWSNRYHRYLWIDGYWTLPREGHVWVPGAWLVVPGGHRWNPGYWRHR